MCLSAVDSQPGVWFSFCEYGALVYILPEPVIIFKAGLHVAADSIVTV